VSWYPATVTTPPTDEPVSVEEARIQTKWDDSNANDAALAIYTASARAHVEAYCGTPIAARTISIQCDAFADFARFPVVPVQSIESIGYVDSDGADQTLDASVYELRVDGLSASIALKVGQSWPAIQSGSRVTVSAVVGYGEVPPDIKHAILLLVGQSDSGRETEPAGAHALLVNHRVYAGA
jgi:uncharacterized phiE125 gp8 family phage protein